MAEWFSTKPNKSLDLVSADGVVHPESWKLNPFNSSNYEQWLLADGHKSGDVKFVLGGMRRKWEDLAE